MMNFVRISLPHFPHEINVCGHSVAKIAFGGKKRQRFQIYVGQMARWMHSIPRAAMSAHTQSEVQSVKAIIIALIVVGIVGLILSAVLPIVGIPGIIGSVAALLAGIGFLIFRCFCCRN
jgi:hypothetical protein